MQDKQASFSDFCTVNQLQITSGNYEDKSSHQLKFDVTRNSLQSKQSIQDEYTVSNRKSNIMHQSMAALKAFRRKTVIFPSTDTNFSPEIIKKPIQKKRNSNQITDFQIQQPIEGDVLANPQPFNTVISRVDRFKNTYIQYPPLIIPLKSQFKLIWDISITIILFWSILYLPWELAFPEDTIQFHNYFLLIIFSMDLLISCRTTYYNKDYDEVVGGHLLLLNYIKSPYFLMDVLSTIPFDMIDSSGGKSSSTITFLKFMKLIRLLRLTRVVSKMKGEGLQVAGTLIKYVFILLIVIHWQTLLWWSLVSRDRESDNQAEILNENNTWLPSIYHVLKDSSSFNTDTIADQISLQSGGISKSVKYFYTFYSMMMLVLGGELTPVNTLQGFEATLFAFIGQLTFAIIFANMSQALFQIRLQNSQQSETLEYYNTLSRLINLPKTTTQSIHEYINFCYHQNVVFNKDVMDFSDLNTILQQEISLVINKQIISDTPLFSQLENYEISLITSQLKVRVLMPNEFVFNVGDIISEMFFIDKGVVKMTKPMNDDRVEKHLLTDGEHFGEHGVMQFWRCNYSIKSITFTITHVLSKQVLENIIAQSPAIESRLLTGQKLYKQEEKQVFYDLCKDLDIFEGLSKDDIADLYINYMENINVNPNDIVIVPDELIHSLYIILDGKLQIYQENSRLLRVNYTAGQQNVEKDRDVFYNSIDDFIYEKVNSFNKVYQAKEIEDRVHFVGEINAGQYFGLVDHSDKRHLKNEQFVIMSSQYSVKLGIINSNIMHLIQQDDRDLYDKLKHNLLRINQLLPLNNINQQINESISLNKMEQPNPLVKKQQDDQLENSVIKLKEEVSSIYRELKDFHRKLRVIRPPKQNLLANN